MSLVAMANFFILLLMAIFIFNVPVKGPFLLLLLGTIIYVIATTGFRRTHLVLRPHPGRRGVRDRHPFDGHGGQFFRPVRAGVVAVRRREGAGPVLPVRLVFSRSSSACSPRRWATGELWTNLLAMAVIALVFLALSLLLLRKQEA